MKYTLTPLKYLLFLAAFALVALPCIAGYAIREIIPGSRWEPVLVILALLPPVLLGASALSAAIFNRRIRSMDVAAVNAYLLRNRQEAFVSSAAQLRKLQRIRHATTVYAVILFFLLSFPAIVGGIYAEALWPLCSMALVFTGLGYFAVFDRFHSKPKVHYGANILVLDKNRFPELYATASRAARALGCRRNIIISLTMDCNATITCDRRGYHLQLGVILLSVFSAEELYCVCLHEFSHVSDKNKASEKEADYADFLSTREERPRAAKAIGAFFSWLDAWYSFTYLIYRHASSVVAETEADRDMAKHGDPATAASALLKLFYADVYFWESEYEDRPSDLAREEPDPLYMTHIVERFRAAIAQRHTDWDILSEKEILANNATHPTLKMRREVLGVKGAQTVEDNSPPAFREETEAALHLMDEDIRHLRATSYSRERREQYLEPLRRVTAWEEAGKPLVAEQYADIVNDLQLLGRHREAKELCDRAILALDDHAMAFACLVKGTVLLHRYDPAGIDLLYRAVEKNNDYLVDGMSAIGAFCCMTGREKELTEYRERAQQLAQRQIDEYSKTAFLSPNDHLTAEHLPGGMLERILTYIRSVDDGTIRKIYLVRKTVNDHFFTSAFVVCFNRDGEALCAEEQEQRDEILHKIYLFLNTYPADWQFSLFDRADCPRIRLDKIKGALVYARPDSKIR